MRPAPELPEDWPTWSPPRKRALRDQLRRARFQARYEFDPVAFVHDCITWGEGEGPKDYQEEALANLVQHGREATRGPHSLGKSAIAAWAILWFAETRDGDDWKAVSTASRRRQLEKYLWPEVHKWARRLRWDVIGREPYDERRELLRLGLRLETGEAFGTASSDPSGIEGAHADRLLYVYDEAKTLTEDLFEATEGAFAGAGPDTGREALGLALSTPGDPEGPFYEIHRRSPRWEHFHATHVTLDRAIAAGQVSASWVEEKRRQWGEESAVFQNRVLGEFATDAGSAVIPLAWVEDAQDRWLERAVDPIAGGAPVIPAEALPPFTCASWDVAGEEGTDQSVVGLRHGPVIAEIRRQAENPDLMAGTGVVRGILRALGGYAVVDVIGIGGGPVARLRELGAKVVAFNAAEASGATDESGELEYANKRAEAWFGMRDRLDPSKNPDPANMPALPPDDQVVGDLTAPKKKTTSAGRLLVESKEEIRKRLKRSTDVGDVIVMAFAARPRALRSSSPARRTLPKVGTTIGGFGSSAR